MSSAAPDVIIIGAGVAGLATALNLAKLGKQVLVLEKYPTLGGRALTYKEGGIQYEIGAGRIFHAHHRVTALVKRYGLNTYPIHSDSNFEHEPNDFTSLFNPIAKELLELDPKLLAMHTIKDILPKTLHPILDMYPYRAEMEVLRADLALPVFKPTAPMGDKAEFYGVKEGYSTLVDCMADEATKAGAIIKSRHRVKSTIRLTNTMFEVSGHYGKKATEKPFKYTAPILIIATCRCSLSQFEVLKGKPLLKQLSTAPLCRIYAIFPKNKNGHVWFKDLPKTVTKNPLRHIIPINEEQGLIMISYTDGRDTAFWKDLEDKALEDEIVRNARDLWPDLDIPKPTFLKKHMWDMGCTYWVPGPYDVEDASAKAQNPEHNLYVVGESINPTQTWIESALESAERLTTCLRKKRI